MGKLFGTDGIRGKANVFPMTPEMALKLGKAVAQYFVKNKKESKHKIVISKDTRLSGYMLESALTAGIISMGVNVILAGPVPTPALAHLTKSFNCDAGIMLTASHNPSEDNGIKIFSEDGYKLPDEIEEEIEKYLLEEKEIDNDHINGNKLGKAKRVDDARGRYVEFAKSSIKSMNLKGIKLVLDCANGAAYKVAPDIFSELGAEVIVLNNNPDGFNINHECGATYPELIMEKVKEYNADLGIALDGDADRIITCDENGNLVDGDQLLTIFALDKLSKNCLTNNTLVVTSYSNLGIDDVLKSNNGKVSRVKNGDRYVTEEMRKNDFVLGGEKSGHIIFSRYATTGDGIISGLKLLKILKESGKKLSELCVMKEYPQRLESFEVKEKTPFKELNCNSLIENIKKELGDQGRVLIRYSGTQNVCRVMVEGKDKNKVEEYTLKIVEALKKEIGA